MSFFDANVSAVYNPNNGHWISFREPGPPTVCKVSCEGLCFCTGQCNARYEPTPDAMLADLTARVDALRDLLVKKPEPATAPPTTPEKDWDALDCEKAKRILVKLCEILCGHTKWQDEDLVGIVESLCDADTMVSGIVKVLVEGGAFGEVGEG